MPQKLLETAKKLEIDGGHGDTWDVFDKDTKRFLTNAIYFAINNGEVIVNETKEDAENTPDG